MKITNVAFFRIGICSTQQEVIVSEELKNPSSKVRFFRLLPDSRK
jgi:hypothetical protein